VGKEIQMTTTFLAISNKLICFLLFIPPTHDSSSIW
jgi:hypothetical protein